MILWKSRLEMMLEEFGAAKKKKQALKNLLNADKISKSTFDQLNKDLEEAAAKIETDRKELSGRLAARTSELEEELKSLEVFLANLEIRHASEEIGEDIYKKQVDALILGLEATRSELNETKEAISKLTREEEGRQEKDEEASEPTD